MEISEVTKGTYSSLFRRDAWGDFELRFLIGGRDDITYERSTGSLALSPSLWVSSVPLWLHYSEPAMIWIFDEVSPRIGSFGQWQIG